MKLLIWDFDGTLAYREGLWSGALLDILMKEVPELAIMRADIAPFLQTGFPWHAPERQNLANMAADAWWEALYPIFEHTFRGVGAEAAMAKQLALKVRFVYTDTSYWRLYEDAVPTLKMLKEQGWEHVVLSNHVPELRQIIISLGLDPYLAGVFNSAETGFEKPHCGAFRMVLEAFQEAREVWMIGDSLVADIEGAEAVGIPAILVRKANEQVKRCCEDLTGIVDILNLKQQF